MQYALVKNGKVVDIFSRLPNHHVFPNGKKNGNFRTWAESNQDKLKEAGFYPLKETRPETAHSYEHAHFSDYIIHQDHVEAIYAKHTDDLEECKLNKRQEAIAYSERSDVKRVSLFGRTWQLTDNLMNFITRKASLIALHNNEADLFPIVYLDENKELYEFTLESFKMFQLVIETKSQNIQLTLKDHLQNIEAISDHYSLDNYDNTINW